MYSDPGECYRCCSRRFLHRAGNVNPGRLGGANRAFSGGRRLLGPHQASRVKAAGICSSFVLDSRRGPPDPVEAFSPFMEMFVLLLSLIISSVGLLLPTAFGLGRSRSLRSSKTFPNLLDDSSSSPGAPSHVAFEPDAETSSGMQLKVDHSRAWRLTRPRAERFADLTPRVDPPARLPSRLPIRQGPERRFGPVGKSLATVGWRDGIGTGPEGIDPGGHMYP